VNWTFGDFLWSMLIFFFWFMFIWMFISIFTDIFRRDLSGWAKAGWIVLIVVLPFLGILIYLIVRPKDETWGGYGGGRQAPPANTGRSGAEEIAKAAQLYDEGKISADEFEHLKRRALSS
jgi:hypothetical protein